MKFWSTIILRLISCILLSIQFSKAQQIRTADSLNNELRKARADTQRVAILNELSLYYYDKDSVKHKEYSNRLVELANKNNYIKGLYRHYNALSLKTYLSGQYAKTEQSSVKQLKAAILLKDTFEIINSSFFVISSTFYQGKPFKNLEAIIKRLDSFNYDPKNNTVLGSLYGILGNYYFYERDKIRAEEYFLKAYKIYKESNNQEGLFSFYTDYTFLLLSENRIIEAEKFAQLAVELGDRIKPHSGMGNLFAVNILGIVLTLQNKLGDANEVFSKLIQQSNDIRNTIVATEAQKKDLLIKNIQNEEEIKRRKLESAIGILLFLLITLIGWLVIRSYHQRKEEKLKDQISMDLHDEVGTIMSRALLYMQSLSEDERKHFELVIDMFKEGNYNLREYVKSIPRKNISAISLYDESIEFIKGFLHRHPYVQFTSNFLGDEYFRVESVLARDIKLIIFEATNNMLKYSGASVYSMDFSIENGILRICLQDNGNLEHVESLAHKGNGVVNIEKRIRRNNGKFSFDINPLGKGLMIDMSFKV